MSWSKKIQEQEQSPYNHQTNLDLVKTAGYKFQTYTKWWILVVNNLMVERIQPSPWEHSLRQCNFSKHCSTPRIQICPKNPGFPLYSYDLGMGCETTINPTRNREGCGVLGIVPEAGLRAFLGWFPLLNQVFNAKSIQILSGILCLMVFCTSPSLRISFFGGGSKKLGYGELRDSIWAMGSQPRQHPTLAVSRSV